MNVLIYFPCHHKTPSINQPLNFLSQWWYQVDTELQIAADKKFFSHHLTVCPLNLFGCLIFMMYSSKNAKRTRQTEREREIKYTKRGIESQSGSNLFTQIEFEDQWLENERKAYWVYITTVFEGSFEGTTLRLPMLHDISLTLILCTSNVQPCMRATETLTPHGVWSHAANLFYSITYAGFIPFSNLAQLSTLALVLMLALLLM